MNYVQNKSRRTCDYWHDNENTRILTKWRFSSQCPSRLNFGVIPESLSTHQLLKRWELMNRLYRDQYVVQINVTVPVDVDLLDGLTVWNARAARTILARLNIWRSELASNLNILLLYPSSLFVFHSPCQFHLKPMKKAGIWTTMTYAPAVSSITEAAPHHHSHLVRCQFTTSLHWMVDQWLIESTYNLLVKKRELWLREGRRAARLVTGKPRVTGTAPGGSVQVAFKLGLRVIRLSVCQSVKIATCSLPSVIKLP